MSEFSNLPQRATYPRVMQNDILVIVLRDHITDQARPVLYIKSPKGSSRIRINSGQDLDTALFTPTGPVDISNQETVQIELPTGVFDALNKVSIMHVLNGEVSVSIRSPIEFYSYFKMPGEAFGKATLSPTTGKSDGWPTSPDPPAP